MKVSRIINYHHPMPTCPFEDARRLSNHGMNDKVKTKINDNGIFISDAADGLPYCLCRACTPQAEVKR